MATAAVSAADDPIAESLAVVRDSVDHLYDVHDRLYSIDKRGKVDLLRRLQAETIGLITAINSARDRRVESCKSTIGRIETMI